MSARDAVYLMLKDYQKVYLSVENAVISSPDKHIFQGVVLVYKCTSCKKVIAKLEDRIRCPYCGSRVFTKQRPEVVKRVLAR